MANKAFVNTSPNATPDYKELFAPEAAGSARIREIEINAAGTYTVGSSDTNTYYLPAEAESMEILYVGGGGGGGGASAKFSHGGGGGAGAVIHRFIDTSSAKVTGAQPLQINIAAGGAGGTSTGGNGVSAEDAKITFTKTLEEILVRGGGGGGGYSTVQNSGFASNASSGGSSSPVPSGTGDNSGGSGGGAGGRAIFASPSTESPSINAAIQEANDDGSFPGDGGLGHFGSGAPPVNAGRFAQPGPGVTIMGRNVAGGGAGGSFTTYFNGGYGATRNTSLASDNPGTAKYGAGGAGASGDQGGAEAGHAGGPGLFVGRYIYNKPSGPNKALTWWETNSGVTENLTGVEYGNGYFVACGASGRIIRSTNGKSWETVTSGTANNLWDIDFDGTHFYVVGSSSTYRRSTDGASWSTYISTGIPASTFDVIGGDVIGTLNSMDYKSSASAFSTWTGAGGVDGIAYAPGIGYVGVGSAGKIVFSATLGGTITTVTPAPTANALYRVAWVAALNMFIAVGAAGTILTSTNGTTWTSRTSGKATAIFQEVSGSPDGWVVAAATDGQMVASSDGITWRNRYSELGLVTSTKGTVATSYSTRGVVYGSGIWVAVGDSGKIVYAIG